MNNPLIIVDPNGMDTLHFDNQGNYLPDQTKKGEGDHVGYYYDADGNLVGFNFNDQSDAASILSSTSDIHKPNEDGFLISGINIGENKTGKLLVSLNSIFGRIPGYIVKQSFENGMMDYTSQISKVDKSINSRLTVIGNSAYNNFDLGNHYWGETMGNLGFTPELAQFAAQIYERVIKQRNDHPTDQRAIGQGARKK